MNFLIIETAFLGDAIISLSLARALKLREPSCRITYLVRPDAVSLVAACPDVDAVLAFDKRGSERGLAGIRRKAEELNALDFDAIFLLHSSSRSQRLSSLLLISRKIGFHTMKMAGLTHHIQDAGWSSRYERAAALAPLVFRQEDHHEDNRDKRPLADPERMLLPRIECEVPARVVAFLKEFSAVVAIAPGSVWKTKQWGDEKYGELAKSLTEQGIGVVLIGGTDALGTSRHIERLELNGVLDLVGRATLTESAGAVAASSLLVSNDSAPMHIAVAVGTPVLAIFGPTVTEFGFAPPPLSGEVIQIDDLWCRPCAPHGSNECPIHTHECMRAIHVERVAAAVRRVIG